MLSHMLYLTNVNVITHAVPDKRQCYHTCCTWQRQCYHTLYHLTNVDIVTHAVPDKFECYHICCNWQTSTLSHLLYLTDVNVITHAVPDRRQCYHTCCTWQTSTLSHMLYLTDVNDITFAVPDRRHCYHTCCTWQTSTISHLLYLTDVNVITHAVPERRQCYHTCCTWQTSMLSHMLHLTDVNVITHAVPDRRQCYHTCCTWQTSTISVPDRRQRYHICCTWQTSMISHLLYPTDFNVITHAVPDRLLCIESDRRCTHMGTNHFKAIPDISKYNKKVMMHAQQKMRLNWQSKFLQHRMLDIISITHDTGSVMRNRLGHFKMRFSSSENFGSFSEILIGDCGFQELPFGCFLVGLPHKLYGRDYISSNGPFYSCYQGFFHHNGAFMRLDGNSLGSGDIKGLLCDVVETKRILKTDNRWKHSFRNLSISWILYWHINATQCWHT